LPAVQEGKDEGEKSMVSILLVGKDPAAWGDFFAELSRDDGLKVSSVGSGQQAWDFLGGKKVDVVVADDELADGPGLSFVHELTKRQPLINCAMVSPLDPKEFHEVTEGLGVFMQLPVSPGTEEAVKMLQLLKSIDALMGT
jgi:DNA-binding NtrC family response regulator